MESKKIDCKCTDKERGIVFNGVDASVRCSVCGKIILKYIDLKVSKLIGLWHTLPEELKNEIRENSA
jgi:hypothetical protein